MNKRVFIEDDDTETKSMFIHRGWDIVNDYRVADLICFTGGSDVSPMLYESVKDSRTFSDPIRDEICSQIFHDAFDKPKVGICRGGQFLNVMAGGELIQHCTGHRMSENYIHEAVSPDGQELDVTSDHHQMMVPCEDVAHEILLTSSICTDTFNQEKFINDLPSEDIEAIFYPSIKSFCFQPHPEWVEKNHECQNYFFRIIQQKLLKG